MSLLSGSSSSLDHHLGLLKWLVVKEQQALDAALILLFLWENDWTDAIVVKKRTMKRLYAFNVSKIGLIEHQP